ncbi:6154_t:CDS:2, partial [Racocetra persica]
SKQGKHWWHKNWWKKHNKSLKFRSNKWFEYWWNQCESKGADWWTNWYNKYAKDHDDGKDVDPTFQHTKEWWGHWWKKYGWKKQFAKEDCDSSEFVATYKKESSHKKSSHSHKESSHKSLEELCSDDKWFEFWWNECQSKESSWWDNWYNKYAKDNDDGKDLDSRYHHTEDWWKKWWKEYESHTDDKWFESWWNECQSKDSAWWNNWYNKYAKDNDDGKDLDAKFHHTEGWWKKWWKEYGYKKHFDAEDCEDFDIYTEGGYDKHGDKHGAKHGDDECDVCKTNSFFDTWWSKFESKDSSWWESFWKKYACDNDDGKDLDPKTHHNKAWWSHWWSQYGWKIHFDDDCEFKDLFNKHPKRDLIKR